VIHLKSVKIRKWDDSESSQFPFSLDIVQSLKSINFDSPVTFFVGENGSGKSTILEALACAIGSITVGSESVKTDPSLASIRKLSQYFQLSWSKRTHKGFFLRAEDFFGYAKTIRQTQQQLETDLERMEKEAHGRSLLAVDMTRAPFMKELTAIKSRYGEGLDSQSHGESFLTLFESRFVPGGLYLLDEPEAALSPSRQLSFIAAMKSMVEKDSQFIITTHSPIIMAFPGATILNFDGGSIRQAEYDELEHVTLMRDFLTNPNAFLRHL
jgi:predicted ATPase